MKKPPNTRDESLKSLKSCFTVSALSKWLVDLAELYRICKHPSVLASIRLVLTARNQKQAEEGRSLHG